MKVRALETVFIDGTRRRAGTVFDVPDNFKLGKHLELADKRAAPKKPLEQGPTTLSEMGKLAELKK